MSIQWNHTRVAEYFEKPLLDLLFEAQTIHRKHFSPNEVQLSTLLNIKTGACPEDCAYCPQSGIYDTGVERESLLNKEEILEEAQRAKASGATRFCMGAAWRSPPAKDFPKILDIIKSVRELKMETCVTLGMLSEEQALALKDAGLDYYNHNLDTSPEHYKKIISTRTYQDRLDTLENLRSAGVKVCCGGIMGMGESREDRIEFLLQLANLPTAPESVPINRLIPIPGTPLANAKPLDNFEFIRTVACARIMMPTSYVRLSAGRESMSEEMQALCFMAGANSIHYGNKLLITSNPEQHEDMQLFAKLGLRPTSAESSTTATQKTACC